jgi:hypothetical protein
MSVRLLRAWFYLRELLGCPRRLTEAEFTHAGPNTLLAGSPWIWVNSSSVSSATNVRFAVTDTTWPRREDS